MCSGVVNVTTLPLTEATSLTSAMGRPERLNQPLASGKGSSTGSAGSWSCQTTRSLAQILAAVGAPFRPGRLRQAAVS